jgi:hypothetical protein
MRSLDNKQPIQNKAQLLLLPQSVLGWFFTTPTMVSE